MMDPILFVMGVLVLLQTSPNLAMSQSGDGAVRVNFCCPDEEILRLRTVWDNLPTGTLQAECVRKKGAKNILEGIEISVLDSKNNQTEVKRTLAKLGNKMPKCGRGLKITRLHTNLYANATSHFYPYGSGYVRILTDGSHVRLLTDGFTVAFDMSSIIRPAEKVDTEDYCLADTWETDNGDSFDDDNEILALSCDPCLEEVLCYFARIFFNGLTGRRRLLIGGDVRQGVIFDNIVRIGDKNGDNAVNFEEFESKIVDYLKIAFKILDRDNDGSIDEVLTNEAIKEYRLEFFEQILENAVEYFDSNEDTSISTEDFLSVLRFNDRNEDGEVTIYELIGLSLINLPAPLYTAYTLLDEDQDEKLTVDEMFGFLRRTFTIIDSNGDCNINLEEIVTALGASNLKEDFQLAIQLIGQQYITLAKYFVDGFIAKADSNKDTKVTLEEIVKFADFSFIDRSIQIALSMGYPNGPTFSYLTGGYRRGHGTWREQRDRAVVVWLTTLNTFLDNPVYQSTPPTHCGLAGQGE
eukprot:GFUD01054078.1.p1 GENE.GFUD01054078.1~~GFUD01054078.1.p1  ORF type:complete len:523 (-),score=119.66 GFUD01054078.1:146-1714(-)